VARRPRYSPSDSELWHVYLPPLKAAVEAGVGNIMTAYLDLNGIPATGNHWLLTEVLRGTWGFGGFIVSDAQAVHNLRTHGFAAAEDGPVLGDPEDAQAGAEIVADSSGRSTACRSGTTVSCARSRTAGRTARRRPRRGGRSGPGPRPGRPTRSPPPRRCAGSPAGRASRTQASRSASWYPPGHPGPGKADPHLARARLRRGQLTGLQRLRGRALLVVPDSTHRSFLHAG
jgi:hypothetical protein